MNVNDCLKKIQDINTYNENRIKILENENRKLKDEQFKDKQIKKLQQSLNELRDEYNRGFPISKEEKDSINKWKEKHEKEIHGIDKNDCHMKQSCCGGQYTYKFIPTSIGTIGIIKCTCGEKFTFQELI